MNEEQLFSWSYAIEDFKSGKYESCEDHLLLVGDYAKIIFNRGMLRLKQEKYAEALGLFQMSLSRDGYLALAQFQISTCLVKLGNFKRALESYRQTALMLRGNTFIDYNQLGLRYRLVLCDILVNLAFCHFKLGESEKALEVYNQALEIAPSAKQIQVKRSDVIVMPLRLFEPDSTKVKNILPRRFMKAAQFTGEAPE
jgi:tetratricopeptide (TPR) repeat protein